MLGRHSATNALAAIVVARHLKVSDASSFAGIAAATGPAWRLQLQTCGDIRILNDAYNANPHSMQAALETLRDMDTSGRRVAVLGDMRELGETADRYHREIGRFLVNCRIDHLCCVGEKAALMAESAIDAGMDEDQVDCFPTANSCATHLTGIVQPDDLILLKASRTIGLEVIAKQLEANQLAKLPA